MSLYRDHGIDAKGLIVGAGEEEEPLRELIRESALEDVVAIHPPMNRIDLAKEMRVSDIYLFASDSREGWGMVAVEAMSEATLVVANAGGGASVPLIRPGVNGFLYRNTAELDAALLEAANPEIRERLGDAGHKTIEEEWVASVAALRLRALIEAIMRDGDTKLFASGPCSHFEVLDERL